MAVEPTISVKKVRPVYINVLGDEIPAPHFAIPYLSRTDLADNPIQLNQGITRNFNLTFPDNDYYPTMITLDVTFQVTSMRHYHDGIIIRVWRITGAAPFYLGFKTYRAWKYHKINTRLVESFPLFPDRIPAGDTLRMAFENWSGDDIFANDINISFVGVLLCVL